MQKISIQILNRVQNKVFHKRSITHYETLNIPQNCSQEEIKTAFHEAAKKTHPDSQLSKSGQDEFLQVKEAFDVLRNPTSRYAYDQLIEPIEFKRAPVMKSSGSSRLSHVHPGSFRETASFRMRLKNIPRNEEERKKILKERELPFMSLKPFVVLLPLVGLFSFGYF
eukprot:snap_masked-scaffold_8-processed-gene-4.15-mRNA-1 protein AED:0.64 eAED:0.64 QI:0/-1/0/1/-1/1/1/0/166